MENTDNSSLMTVCRGFNIFGLAHGLGSNNKELIYKPIFFERGEVYSQVTNWENLTPIEFSSKMDSNFLLLDDANLPFNIKLEEENLYIQGDIGRIERDCFDKRWSILGNMGIWFRYILRMQENHEIFSLHAASIYKPEQNELVIVAGKAGAGKTVFLLESIIKGYQIFSTEMTYFRINTKGIKFYRGALMDNIRVGCLQFDFPETADKLGLNLPKVSNPWSHKISVDMHSVTTLNNELVNPNLLFIFPRIEKGQENAVVEIVSQQRTLLRMLYEVASEKIGNTLLINEELPAVGFDTPVLAKNRWKAIKTLVTAPQWEVKQAISILAGPKSCKEVI